MWLRSIPLHIVKICLAYLSTLLLSTQSQENKKCREKDRLITTESGDLYTLIDATLYQKLILQCHYCNENDDSQPRNWYKIDKLGLTRPHEVQLSMENEMELNRIRVNTEHSLIINNFSGTDTGLYYCIGYGEQDEHEKYNYLVDLVFENNATEIETGNISAWAKYHDDHFAPINDMFTQSNGKEFAYIREHLKLSFEVISQWDPWGMCEVCGRPSNNGLRRKKGQCRIKITRYDVYGENVTTNDPEEKYILNANAISCRSQRLSILFPGVSNITRVIPDFVQDQKCEGTCNPDAEGVNRGWKVGKSSAFKYRKTFVLQEKSHLTLVCPESSLENTVIWKKRGKVLKAGDASNPNLIVDTFSTLYLLDVTEQEAGNYTCQVDDIKMQQVRVFIVSKLRLLTQEFLRHLLYLGFILSLTVTCYCAGLIVTCHRRRTFKTYEELVEEHPEKDELTGLLKKPKSDQVDIVSEV